MLYKDKWSCGEFSHDVSRTRSLAGTMKVKSANIQVGDLIIVEKVSGSRGRVRASGQSLPPRHDPAR